MLDTNWTKTYDEIITKTAEISGKDKEDVIKIMESFFEGMKFYVTIPTMPTFLVKKYFAFGADIPKIKRKVSGALRVRTPENEERIKKIIRITWRVIKRKEAEKDKRYTNYFWMKIEKRLKKEDLYKVDLEDIFQGVIKKMKNTLQRSLTTLTGKANTTSQNQ